MTLVPHFSFPFQLSGTSFATVEQDSIDDIAACVLAVLNTRPGQRELLPAFGLEDLTFDKIPLDTSLIAQAVARCEPRAEILLRENPDMFDRLVDRVTVAVSARS